VIYAKAFFDLQLRFASTVATLLGRPLARALLEYTNLYIRFGLGRDFNAADPEWQAYLAGLNGPERLDEWTYDFYLSRRDADVGPAVVATVGCFSYAVLSAQRVRLHFHDADHDGLSPLAPERASRRRAELAGLFEHVKRTAHRATRVIGASWLYNLEAYRRLFPNSYLATARPMPRCFQHLPLWGQFLDRHGAVREKPTREFLDHLERQSSADGLDRCFPFQALSVDAAVQDFYDFYGVR
jgi:hypothetical protein